MHQEMEEKIQRIESTEKTSGNHKESLKTKGALRKAVKELRQLRQENCRLQTRVLELEDTLSEDTKISTKPDGRTVNPMQAESRLDVLTKFGCCRTLY